VSTRAQQIIPAGVQCSATELKAEQNLPLKEMLLLVRLAARYPQVAVVASMAAADKAELDALPQSFRRTIFRGIIMGRRPSTGLRLLDRFGLLEYFLPEVTAGRGLTQNRFHAHDIFEHLLRSVDGAMDLNEPVRWSALLHDIGKVPTRVETGNGEATFHNHEMYSARMVVPIMKRLAVPIKVGQKVKFLVRNHMFHYTDEWSDKAVRRFVKKVPLEELQDLISLRLADRKGSGKKTAFPKALQKLIDHIDEIIAKEQEFKIKDLAVNGHTLMEMGIPASRQMGDILKFLHAEVVAGRAPNKSEVLVALVRQKMTEQQAG
jgi:UTP:GlnB (protein PII) uridylyltransferase